MSRTRDGDSDTPDGRGRLRRSPAGAARSSTSAAAAVDAAIASRARKKDPNGAGNAPSGPAEAGGAGGAAATGAAGGAGGAAATGAAGRTGVAGAAGRAAADAEPADVPDPAEGLGGIAAEPDEDDEDELATDPHGIDAIGPEGPDAEFEEPAAGPAGSAAAPASVAAAPGSVGAALGAPPRTSGIAAAATASKVGRGTAIRTRILPRSVLGIASLILALAVGAGFSGVVLFSYYQYKLNQTNDRVNTLVSGYKKQFTNAEGDLGAAVAAAKLNIQNQLKAVEQLQAGPATLAALVKQVAPSVFFVHTLDANGQASVGTAFVVSSNATQSLLLTSYTTVKAATVAPGPAVFVRQGSTDTPVTVRTWDPQYDLALLVLPQGGLHPLPAATPTPAPQPGDRIYAVSGLGAAGASIAQGNLIDVAASGVTEDAAIGPSFQGGPLIDQTGQVVAVASRTYSPLAFSTDGVWFAPYVEAACNKVLVCPGGTLVGSH